MVVGQKNSTCLEVVTPALHYGHDGSYQEIDDAMDAVLFEAHSAGRHSDRREFDATTSVTGLVVDVVEDVQTSVEPFLAPAYTYLIVMLALGETQLARIAV
jgi:hypothetical protein